MATLTKGKTFVNGELVTPQKLHELVDLGSVANIVNADISAGAAIADTKLAAISTANKVANSATTAASANTANAIVARDGSGNFSAGTITANLTGNASTATTLQTARAINGVAFNGSQNITVTATPNPHNHDDRYYTETEIDSKLSGLPVGGHNHDDRYYTETEMNTLLAGKQASGSYAPATGIAPSAITGTAVVTSDPRLSDARTPTTHTHDASAINAGTLAIARIPTGATATTVCIGNDSRLSDARTPTNGSVTTAKIADGAVTRAQLDSSVPLVPTGAVIPFAMNSAPSGWLAADGSAVSRTTYAALFAAIGTTYGGGDNSNTFTLPDLRGIFVRGTGSQTISGITYSGTLGTKQNDAMQGHYHNILTNTTGAGSSPLLKAGAVGAVSVVGATTIVTDGTNGQPRVGAETNPANIALLYCIKF
jgi:microcystin-dependent protein